MKDDPRFCPVCNKLLLKQDRYRFVLVVRCDTCYHLIHERCYLQHHIRQHELIGVITEIKETEVDSLYNRNKNIF